MLYSGIVFDFATFSLLVQDFLSICWSIDFLDILLISVKSFNYSFLLPNTDISVGNILHVCFGDHLACPSINPDFIITTRIIRVSIITISQILLVFLLLLCGHYLLCLLLHPFYFRGRGKSNDQVNIERLYDELLSFGPVTVFRHISIRGSGIRMIGYVPSEFRVYLGTCNLHHVYLYNVYITHPSTYQVRPMTSNCPTSSSGYLGRIRINVQIFGNYRIAFTLLIM